MKLSHQQLRLCIHATGVFITLSMIAIVHFCVLNPADADIADASQVLEDGRKIIQEKQKIVADAETAECESYATEQRLKELRALVPNLPEESNFLSQLATLSTECGLDIDRFQPGRPELGKRVNRIRVELNGSGSYDCLCRFLDGLHSLQRLTEVSKLSVEASPVVTAHEISMELSIFYANEPATKVAQRTEGTR